MEEKEFFQTLEKVKLEKRLQILKLLKELVTDNQDAKEKMKMIRKQFDNMRKGRR
jgi:hypothetical protein